MKLLLDQNLSPRLASRLSDVFAGSAHVDSLGLGSAPDFEVWNYARDNGFIVVSKDADFSEISLLRGHPPKLVWLRLGNCTTAQIETTLRSSLQAIEEMAQDETVGILSLV